MFNWRLWLPVYIGSGYGDGEINATMIFFPWIRRAVAIVRAPWLKRPCLRWADWSGAVQIPGPPDDQEISYREAA